MQIPTSECLEKHYLAFYSSLYVAKIPKYFVWAVDVAQWIKPLLCSYEASESPELNVKPDTVLFI